MYETNPYFYGTGRRKNVGCKSSLFMQAQAK